MGAAGGAGDPANSRAGRWSGDSGPPSYPVDRLTGPNGLGHDPRMDRLGSLMAMPGRPRTRQA
jgi:hypothetical protein